MKHFKFIDNLAKNKLKIKLTFDSLQRPNHTKKANTAKLTRKISILSPTCIGPVFHKYDIDKINQKTTGSTFNSHSHGFADLIFIAFQPVF